MMADKEERLRRIVVMILEVGFLSIVALPLLLRWSAERVIAGDEGFYLLAGQLVATGQLPYRDFFFPQAPALAGFWGLFFSFVDPSWSAARLIGGGTAFVALALVWVLLLPAGRCVRVVTVLVVLFSGMTVGWMTIAKSYQLTAVAMLVALLWWGSGRLWLLSACGAAFACAARPYLLPVLMLLPLLHPAASRGEKLRWCAVLGGGLFVLFVPAMLFPAESWFGIVGYHLDKHPVPPLTALAQKGEVLGAIFGVVPHPEIAGWSLALILWSLVGVTALSLKNSGGAWRYGAIALAIGAVSLVPTPTYVQYLVLVVPVALVAIAMWTVDAPVRLEGSQRPHSIPTMGGDGNPRLGRTVIVVALLGFSLVEAPREVERFLVTGEGVRGQMAPNPWPKTVREVEDVIATVKGTINPGDTILLEWPGFAVGLDAQVPWGNENQFGYRAARLVEDGDRESLRVATKEELRSRALAGDIDWHLTATEGRFFGLRDTLQNLDPQWSMGRYSLYRLPSKREELAVPVVK